MFRLEFKTGNAAFDIESGLEEECARIIECVKQQVLCGQTSGTCIDINGNTVGAWAYMEE